MTSYPRYLRLVAASLSAVAGFVDALGFLKLQGFFVSFMSGNSTRLGVGIASSMQDAITAGALIATFLAGVVLGSLVANASGPRTRQLVLISVASLLAVAAALGSVRLDRAAIVAMGLAMGAMNAAFERNGEVSIGLTYMTGTLVKFGQNATLALLGRKGTQWASYLMLWTAFAAGAVAGAALYPAWALGGLWIAAVAVSVLALACRTLPDD